MARSLLLEAAAIAGQIAQVALGLRGNEGGFEQAMLQQISNPLGIFRVGFATRNCRACAGH
ncbi:hypothetical protein KSX_53960 [Ktedonospora formicarum]|uniref:Uncharacterized protein n=1 Tax=Ktedonospora formicarum TaxID=2778364 RepID=A0A8J3MV27_9CHLR|nr:hypothetical protein KSX_53960 [Ktedonospora formicarum]